MMSKDDSIKWLQKCTDEYHSGKNDMHETIEDLDDMEKLGQGFSSADPFEEIDIGDGSVARPTFINANMEADRKARYVHYLKNLLISLLGIIPRCLV
jgi:hypothetical protein